MKENERLFRALAREGMEVRVDGAVYTIRLKEDPNHPPAEVLLPASLPVEARAFRQLADLAGVKHPLGGRVQRVIATPDFHPGDAGVAIGSVVASEDLVIPQAVGSDINCGMRLHGCDIPLDHFLSRKAEWVAKMKGDYLLGTRDLVFRHDAMAALFKGGVPAWLEALRQAPAGSMARADLDQIEGEQARILDGGALVGDVGAVPADLVPDQGWVRDGGIGTIGRGNHFVELQWVEEIVDRKWAWAWGLKAGQLAILIHSGSRDVGRSVGRWWEEKARAAWPVGHKFPPSGIFPLQRGDPLATAYLQAEGAAGNYGFVNRLLLAELYRLRLREVFGASVAMPLIADLPHNITRSEGTQIISRKGACPAHADQPVLIPGSMGAASFVAVGKGNTRFLCSASHGAGRLSARGALGRSIRDEHHRAELGLTGVECITLHEERLLEEAPVAYKPVQAVIDAQVQAESIGVVAVMRPILTFKA